MELRLKIENVPDSVASGYEYDTNLYPHSGIFYRDSTETYYIVAGGGTIAVGKDEFERAFYDKFVESSDSKIDGLGVSENLLLKLVAVASDPKVASELVSHE